MLMRLRVNEASWIGRFECGDTHVTTFSLLPDLEHLFVCAAGAGYIIDVKSQDLVERIGNDIVGTMLDEAFTLFVVDHNGTSLEAFGKTGRLWKTATISAGGFRGMCLSGDALVGEARSPTGGWVRFSVKIATGDYSSRNASAG
jgi:hypothetical protein